MRRTDDTPRLKIVPVPPHGIDFEGSEVVLDRDGVPIAVFNNPKHARILLDALNTGVSGAALTAEPALTRDEVATLNDTIAAMRYLAKNDRPSGGEDAFNYAWLMDRYERLRSLRDRHTPPPALIVDGKIKAGDVLGTIKTGNLSLGGEVVGEVVGVAFNPRTGETREVHADDLPPEVRKAFEGMGFDKAGEVKPTDDDDDDDGEGSFEIVGNVIERIFAGLGAAMDHENRRLIISNAVKDRVKTIGVEAMGLPWDAGRVYKAGDSASHEGVLWTFWPQHGEDPEKDVYGYGFNGIEPGSEHSPEWWNETASDFDLTRCDCVGCKIAQNAEPHLKAQRAEIDAATAEKAEAALKAAEAPLTAPNWEAHVTYRKGDRVAFEGQVWAATRSIGTDGPRPGHMNDHNADHDDGHGPTTPTWAKVVAEAPAPAAELTAPDWEGNKRYLAGDRVAYNGQVWEADYCSIMNGLFTPGGEKSEAFASMNNGKPAWRKVENTTDGLAPTEKTT